MYCKCGRKIEEARMKATHGKAKTCMKCMNGNDVPRVAGFMPREQKMQGSILLVDQDTAKQLHKASSRAGYGVARGVKFTKEAKSMSNQL